MLLLLTDIEKWFSQLKIVDKHLSKVHWCTGDIYFLRDFRYERINSVPLALLSRCIRELLDERADFPEDGPSIS